MTATDPDFNPRSPHGERLIHAEPLQWPCNFNPRSPHGERRAPPCAPAAPQRFQSTLPARGATQRNEVTVNFCKDISIHAPRTGSDRIALTASYAEIISIHAPRTGSDKVLDFHFLQKFDFNPRSPHGERQLWSGAALTSWQFQSTLPARGATRRHQICH